MVHNNKDFDRFVASRQEITYQQALQVENIAEVMNNYDKFDIVKVFAYEQDFFIIQVASVTAQPLFIVPGEFRDYQDDTIEDAEQSLFEENKVYIIDEEETEMTNSKVPMIEKDSLEKNIQSDKQNWIINYKWAFIVSFTNAQGVAQYMYPINSFGPDYLSAKNFLLIRMKNKKQALHKIFSARAVAVHFAYYADFQDVPKELYASLPLPEKPAML
jgi:hypothetical protein